MITIDSFGRFERVHAPVMEKRIWTEEARAAAAEARHKSDAAHEASKGAKGTDSSRSESLAIAAHMANDSMSHAEVANGHERMAAGHQKAASDAAKDGDRATSSKHLAAADAHSSAADAHRMASKMKS